MMTFCEKCHEFVAYKSENVQLKRTIKGKEITFEGKVASCHECGSELFVANIRDYNLKQLDTAYRNSLGLISVPEIQHILEKYDIGKRPLSNILGWGEITLTRYLDGAIPTKQYSDRLYEIYNNPDNMDFLLETNKAKITESAYKKCKMAIGRFKQFKAEEFLLENKIERVTKYLLLKSSEITPLALQKLLYYSQAFNKAFNDIFLFEDDCQAWSHGPVYNDIYHKYKGFGFNPIELTMPFEESELNISDSEKEVLDTVIRNFGCYSGKILEKMTHSEHPWLTTRNGLQDDEPSNEIIEKDIIEHYFEQIKQKYNMLSTSDISDYSKDLFDKLFN